MSSKGKKDESLVRQTLLVDSSASEVPYRSPEQHGGMHVVVFVIHNYTKIHAAVGVEPRRPATGINAGPTALAMVWPIIW
jgi:hypothetical protein